MEIDSASLQALGFWCVGTALFMLGGLMITIMFLRHGIKDKSSNKRYNEMLWQARDRNIDWWLAIDKRGGVNNPPRKVLGINDEDE
jgi:hypothetical protein